MSFQLHLLALVALLFCLTLSTSVHGIIIHATNTASTGVLGTVIGNTAFSGRATTSGSEVDITITPSLVLGLNVGLVSTASLPAGASSTLFSGGLNLELGYDVSVALSIGNSSAFSLTITTPTITNYANLIATGNVLTILKYDTTAKTYTKIPASQTIVNLNNSIQLTVSVAGRYYFTFQTSVIQVTLLTPYSVAANSNVNFALSEGSGIGTVKLNNLNCAAGSVTFSESTNATAETNAVSTGKVLVSKVYTFTHSAGGAAVTSANLVFDASQSATAQAKTTANLATAQWYTYISATSSWQLQGGSVSGSVTSYTATHFSDWSVQASVNAAFGMATASFGLINLLVAALGLLFCMA